MACGSPAFNIQTNTTKTTNDDSASATHSDIGATAMPPSIDVGITVPSASGALTPVGFCALTAPTTTASANLFLSLALRAAPGLCVSLDAASNPIASRLSNCSGATEQLFALSGAHQLVSGKLRPSDRTYMCLTGTAAAGAHSGTVSLSPCKDAPNDTWSQLNHQWLHNKTGLCLSGDMVRNPTQPTSLQPCDSTNTYQLWAVGDWNIIAQQAAAANANVPVSTMCNGAVLLVLDPNDPGTQRMIARYGSVQNMGAYLNATKQKDCQVMFQSGGQVPFYTDLRIEFLPHTAGAMATYTSERTIGVYTDFWNTVDESDQPFSLRVDTAFAHEITHALHLLTGVPAAFVEGYANWVPYRIGLLRASEKMHGGQWTDGYSHTAFFMLWLDDQPVAHAMGQRFTDNMRAQAALHVTSPTWFFPWFQDAMGQDPNALWRTYQDSF